MERSVGACPSARWLWKSLWANVASCGFVWVCLRPSWASAVSDPLGVSNLRPGDNRRGVRSDALRRALPCRLQRIRESKDDTGFSPRQPRRTPAAEPLSATSPLALHAVDLRRSRHRLLRRDAQTRARARARAERCGLSPRGDVSASAQPALLPADRPRRAAGWRAAARHLRCRPPALASARRRPPAAGRGESGNRAAGTSATSHGWKRRRVSGGPPPALAPATRRRLPPPARNSPALARLPCLAARLRRATARLGPRPTDHRPPARQPFATHPPRRLAAARLPAARRPTEFGRRRRRPTGGIPRGGGARAAHGARASCGARKAAGERQAVTRAVAGWRPTGNEWRTAEGGWWEARWRANRRRANGGERQSPGMRWVKTIGASSGKACGGSWELGCGRWSLATAYRIEVG